MLNNETVYWQAGFKAGVASKHGDVGMVRFQKDWLNRAVALESGTNKKIAQDAYKRGYSEAARV